MTRLIDADSIPWFVEGVGDIPVITKEEIDDMPTVDAIPVVRCKDCKWWKAEKEECIEWYDSPYAPADGYCFRAERKEE